MPDSRHKTLGQRIGGTIDFAVGSINTLGRTLVNGSPLAITRKRSAPGTAAGIESNPEIHTPPEPGDVQIRVFDYGTAAVSDQTLDLQALETMLQSPVPEELTVRWINIDGLHPYVVRQVQQRLGFHTLAAEDVLNVPQRPKIEPYENELFVVTRMIRLVEGAHLISEQVTFFLRDRLLVSFQETPGDVFDPIRARLSNDASRLRQNDASYLLYALLDAIVDHGYPLLEHYGQQLEHLEEQILEQTTTALLSRIHGAKRELTVLRRVMWPMRQVVSDLQQEDLTLVSPMTRTYLRDVHEHAVQLVEILESYREVANSLTDLYMSMQGNRANEIMKVLTIMASVFIPITFFAGIYGMNFDVLPELHWKYGYLYFWGVCAVVTGGLLGWFWHRGWIGRG